MHSKKDLAQKQNEAEEQINNLQKIVDYNTMEPTVELLVQKFRLPQEEQPAVDEGDIYIPDYQRALVWSENTQAKFIESLILGLPIPFLFMADMQDGRLEIVDGTQRIRTLHRFLHNELCLTQLEKLDSLNGFKFSELPIARQRKFKNRTIRVVVLSDKADEEVRRDLFERINTGSVALKDMEVRKGIYPGPFGDFIIECAQNEQFNRLCPVTVAKRKSGESEELVLRFFAYSDHYLEFKHEVKKFLDHYMKTKNQDFDREEMTQRFIDMLNFVEKYFPTGFKKTPKATTTPRVRFEAIAVGIYLALKEQPDLVPKEVSTWLDSEKFKELTTSDASNSAKKLQGRIEFVRDALLGKRQEN